MIIKSITYGFIGIIALLSVYFGIITLISGSGFVLQQFFQFWYFIVGLAIGFGIQIGLYVYLKNVIKTANSSKKVLTVTGATSTAAMISCCAHYLANILPFIAVTGIISLISQYQIELFWIGLVFNLVGIVYITRKVIKFHNL